MEQIIVTILLVLAAIADWALFVYAVDCDANLKKIEPFKAEALSYLSIIALGVTLLASWLQKEAILTSEWGIMWGVLLLMSALFGALAWRLFDLQMEKKPSEE